MKEIKGLTMVTSGKDNVFTNYDEAAFTAKKLSIVKEDRKVYVLVKAASGKGIEYIVSMSAAGRVEEYWLNGKQGS